MFCCWETSQQQEIRSPLSASVLQIKELRDDTIISPSRSSGVLWKQRASEVCDMQGRTLSFKKNKNTQPMESLRLRSGVEKTLVEGKATEETGQPPGQKKACTFFDGERERGTVCSLELYATTTPPPTPLTPPYPSPHKLGSTKGTLPLVPTHKEFLRHCWVLHDNWALNKAFLLGILPFTAKRWGGGEGGGHNSQRRGGGAESGGWWG